MLKFSPILLAVLYAIVMYRFSAWRLARELNHKSTELTDPVLNRLTQHMADVLDVSHIRVYIYEIKTINGLAFEDGRIFITRGFYQKYQSDGVSAEELASVIAHELGHVALGHARRRMITFSGQNAIRVALSMVLGRFIPGIGVYIANGLSHLLMAGLSRRDEYEADAYAAALLTKAGIGTAPQKSLFLKLDKLTDMSGAALAWLMSHPKTEKRIEAIRKLENKWSH